MADLNSTSGSSSSTDSSSSGTSHPIEPRFRLACEECHIRKVRCEPSLTGSGGSCEACRLNQRRCLFSLRSKIGRPRKQTTSIKTKAAAHSPTAMPITGGYPQTMTVLQMLAQSEDLLESPNGSQPPKDSSQDQLNARRRAPDETSRWESTAWHPISETLTEDPVRDVSADYNFEETGRFGTDSERFGQLMTPNTVGAQIEFFASDFARTTESLQMDALMMESCHAAGDVTESSETDGEQEFHNALKLYGELHNRCKSSRLDILAETDQDELSLIFQTLDKLNQTTSVLQNNPSSQQQRTEQSKWRIVRVAVIEAVEMCIGIIEFNFHLYNSLGSMDDGRSSAEEPSQTSSGSVAGCNCLAPKDEHRLEVQLRGLELLIRLDHSLTRFRLFMSKQDCSHGSDRYRDSSSFSGSKPRTPCQCWITSIPEIGAVRSRISELSDRLRGLWD